MNSGHAQGNWIQNIMKSHQVAFLELVKSLYRAYCFRLERKISAQTFHKDAENNGKIGSHKKHARLTRDLISIIFFFQLSSLTIPAIVPFFPAFISLITAFALFVIICSDKPGKTGKQTASVGLERETGLSGCFSLSQAYFLSFGLHHVKSADRP